MADFNDLLDDGWEGFGVDPERTTDEPRPAAHCTCGRFARYLGMTSGFDGSFTTMTEHVECSRCGTIDIELV